MTDDPRRSFGRPAARWATLVPWILFALLLAVSLDALLAVPVLLFFSWAPHFLARRLVPALLARVSSAGAVDHVSWGFGIAVGVICIVVTTPGKLLLAEHQLQPLIEHAEQFHAKTGHYPSAESDFDSAVLNQIGKIGITHRDGRVRLDIRGPWFGLSGAHYSVSNDGGFFVWYRAFGFADRVYRSNEAHWLLSWG